MCEEKGQGAVRAVCEWLRVETALSLQMGPRREAVYERGQFVNRNGREGNECSAMACSREGT